MLKLSSHFVVRGKEENDLKEISNNVRFIEQFLLEETRFFSYANYLIHTLIFTVVMMVMGGIVFYSSKRFYFADICVLNEIVSQRVKICRFFPHLSRMLLNKFRFKQFV